MYKWGLIVCFLIFCVNSNDAVDCYGCIASKISDCYNGKTESYFLQDCDAGMNNSTENIENVCIQFIQIEPIFNQKIVQRGCGFIWKGVDICAYLSNVTKIEDCYYCRENYCNGAAISN